VSVGAGFYEAGLAAAESAARILGGQAPGAIPMANLAVVKRELNYAVARNIGYSFSAQLVDSTDVCGLKIPPALLARADRVIW